MEEEIEDLQAKIIKAECMVRAMKAVNKIVRQAPKNVETGDKIREIIALGLVEKTARNVFKPDFCGRIGFAAYELTNRGARIRAWKAKLRKMAGEPEPPKHKRRGSNTKPVRPTPGVRGDIERAYYRLAQGQQISIMDIPKVFDESERAIISGAAVDQAVRAAILMYCQGSR